MIAAVRICQTMLACAGRGLGGQILVEQRVFVGTEDV
jgi:hypothetical protein